MITPFVLRAFKRLASAAAAMEVLEGIAAGEEATPTKVNRFLDEISEADPGVNEVYEEARRDPSGDAWEAVRNVVEDVLRNVGDGVGRAHSAFSRKDIHGLLVLLKSVMSNAAAGIDRGTMSRGLRAELGEFSRRADEGDQGVWQDIGRWIEEKFPQPIESLTNMYMSSYPVGWDKPKGSLLGMEHGAAAKGVARDTVLGMLFEVVRSKVQDRSYEWKYDSDMKTYNTIAANVSWKIRGRDTGDKYDLEKPQQSTAQKNWMRYVEPLQGTDMFPSGGRPDLGAIAEWLNDNFRRDTQETLTVAVPGGEGGTITAQSFKKPKTRNSLMTWYQATLPVQSLDVEMTEDGGTLGESLVAPERPDDEEKRVEHLNAPAPDKPGKTRRDIARDELRAMVHKSVESLPVSYKAGGVTPNTKDVVENMMLVKLGLASGSDREAFRKKLEGLVAREPGKEPRIRRMPFRIAKLNIDEWKEQGKPSRNKKSADPPGVLDYVRDFDQRALVWKAGTTRAGEQFSGSLPSLWKNKDDLKVSVVTHKAGDPVDLRHFRDWAPYTEDDWGRDLGFALDVYDGQKWYQHSIDPAFQKRLEKKDADLSKVFEGFDPMKMWVAASKGTDQELLRVLGQVMPSVAATSDSLFPVYSGVWVPLKRVMKKLGDMLKEGAEQDNYLPLEYLALKGSGAIASAPRRTMRSTEHIVRAVVELLDAGS